MSANDGRTVAIGGLITRRDEKQERKVPWLGDLPYLGAGFRFRTHTKQRTELLILLTPHIVRNPADAERIKAEEASKMDWTLSDVEAIHGPLGLPPLVPGLPDGLAVSVITVGANEGDQLNMTLPAGENRSVSHDIAQHVFVVTA